MKTHRRTTLLLGAAALAALASAATREAGAVGDTNAELGVGGTIRGDISTEAGEADTVGVTWVAGEPLDIVWSAGFHSALTLTDPDGLEVDLGVQGDRFRKRGFVAPKSGRFRFRVASSDGTQGFWTLSVRPAWPKKVAVQGTGDGSVTVAMPAGASMSGKIRGTAAPTLLALMDPGDQQILGPVAPKKNTVTLPRTTAALDGAYTLQVDVADPSTAWSGTIVRKVRRAKLGRFSVTNGLTPVSFETDGVGKLFAKDCGSCHDWARSYVGVRSVARESLSRMRSGNMPKDAPRTGAADLSLVEQWILTGSNR